VLGYLAAYSGKLANSNHIDFLVPPVFDMLIKDGYFYKEEAVLNNINKQIELLENDITFLKLKSDVEKLKVQANNEILYFKQLIKENKLKRKHQRDKNREHLSTEDFEKLEADLIKQSLFDKH